ncbi:hypothetical protein WICPIJ_007308 [Wickerhamomyces pijperi]|uniref:Uncharacterized protein n=1 Tax=Wickerhamomyces pijperi TaxID=599730 RepID=A0A9P8TK18_WICPI|nr:hypothetical protein WICPIJ_007308 [Wickerhamomyces pijperi]
MAKVKTENIVVTESHLLNVLSLANQTLASILTGPACFNRVVGFLTPVGSSTSSSSESTLASLDPPMRNGMISFFIFFCLFGTKRLFVGTSGVDSLPTSSSSEESLSGWISWIWCWSLLLVENLFILEAISRWFFFLAFISSSASLTFIRMSSSSSGNQKGRMSNLSSSKNKEATPWMNLEKFGTSLTKWEVVRSSIHLPCFLENGIEIPLISEPFLPEQGVRVGDVGVDIGAVPFLWISNRTISVEGIFTDEQDIGVNGDTNPVVTWDFKSGTGVDGSQSWFQVVGFDKLGNVFNVRGNGVDCGFLSAHFLQLVELLGLVLVNVVVHDEVGKRRRGVGLEQLVVVNFEVRVVKVQGCDGWVHGVVVVGLVGVNQHWQMSQDSGLHFHQIVRVDPELERLEFRHSFRIDTSNRRTWQWGTLSGVGAVDVRSGLEVLT